MRDGRASRQKVTTAARRAAAPQARGFVPHLVCERGRCCESAVPAQRNLQPNSALYPEHLLRWGGAPSPGAAAGERGNALGLRHLVRGRKPPQRKVAIWAGAHERCLRVPHFPRDQLSLLVRELRMPILLGFEHHPCRIPREWQGNTVCANPTKGIDHKNLLPGAGLHRPRPC
jgi:hypothetical protein